MIDFEKIVLVFDILKKNTTFHCSLRWYNIDYQKENITYIYYQYSSLTERKEEKLIITFEKYKEILYGMESQLVQSR